MRPSWINIALTFWCRTKNIIQNTTQILVIHFMFVNETKYNLLDLVFFNTIAQQILSTLETKHILRFMFFTLEENLYYVAP